MHSGTIPHESQLRKRTGCPNSLGVTPQGECTWENHAGRQRHVRGAWSSSTWRACPALAFRTDPTFFPVYSLRLFFLGNKYTNIIIAFPKIGVIIDSSTTHLNPLYLYGLRDLNTLERNSRTTLSAGNHNDGADTANCNKAYKNSTSQQGRRGTPSPIRSMGWLVTTMMNTTMPFEGEDRNEREGLVE
jgi:hypothetical protein